MKEIKTFKFTEFKEAFEFMRQQRLVGNNVIYYPRGGDNPRKFTTDPVEHVVMTLGEQK